MKLLSIDYVPGEEIIQAIGIVKGQTVQSKNIGRDFMLCSIRMHLKKPLIRYMLR